jgi:Tol biopolymer transport system component
VKTLAAGSRLGPYEVLAPIGAGGMGEVYRARDTRLGRDVAVKVLPGEFAADPDRLRRFAQEARAASALSDAHIVTVYDTGDANGIHYFVCELVEGSSLRTALGRSVMPIRRTLECAEQIASGLAAAHEKGIVHRDLKPENILLTKSGQAKIADFGLAKLTEQSTANISELPTSDGHHTSAGVVMGTVGYMSPEQARGANVDFRSDQFSLGTILYEMVTGARPFQRETVPQTLAAIIQDEPAPIHATGPEATLLRWIIERLLAKDPEDRFSSTKDLARDLQSIRQHLSEAGALSSGPSAAAAAGLPRSWRGPAVAIAAGAALVTALALVAGRASKPAPPVRYQQLSFRRGTIWNARFAPDGHTVVYSGSFESNPIEIFEKQEGSSASRPLGLPGDDLLSISRTGQIAISLAVRPTTAYPSMRRGTLAELSPGGTTAPRELLDNVYVADWAPDGSVAVVRDTGTGFQLEYPAGKVVYRTAGWISHARVSRDGRAVAFLEHPAPNDDGGSVAIVDSSGRHRRLATGYQSEEGLAWSADGREVWFTANPSGQNLSLYAVALDGRIRVVQQVPGALMLRDVAPDGKVLASREGWRVGMSGRLPGDSRDIELSWLDWSLAADISKDGRSILFLEASEGGGAGYSVYLRKGKEPAARLGQGFAQRLSPDLASVVAILNSAGDSQLAIYPTGLGQSRLLPREGLTVQRADWMPDGRRLLVSANEAGKGVRLWIVDATGGKPAAISAEGFRQFNRCILPDGSKVVADGPDGKIYLCPLDGGKPAPLVGLTDAEQPSGWLSDNQSFFVYRRSEVPAKVYTYDIATGSKKIWAELTPPDPTGIVLVNRFMATPDGSAFVYNYTRYLSELFEIDGLK